MIPLNKKIGKKRENEGREVKKLESQEKVKHNTIMYGNGSVQKKYIFAYEFFNLTHFFTRTLSLKSQNLKKKGI